MLPVAGGGRRFTEDDGRSSIDVPKPTPGDSYHAEAYQVIERWFNSYAMRK